MNERDARPNTGTLEALLRQIDGIPADAAEFQMWVPEELTYEGETITQEVAMGVLLDQLLAREMFPHGHQQDAGGRTYRYRRESTGAAPQTPARGASGAAQWLVRALRAVGIGTREPETGQVWRYRTRNGEEESRVQVLRIDVDPQAGEIMHIAVTGIRMERQPGDPSPIAFIGHVPLSRAAFEASAPSLETANAELPDFEEGYAMWRAGFEAGKAGVFSVPVAEIIDAIEAGVRDSGR